MCGWRAEQVAGLSVNAFSYFADRAYLSVVDARDYTEKLRKYGDEPRSCLLAVPRLCELRDS